MEKNGCDPNVATFNIIMHEFLQNNDTEKVVELHKSERRNRKPDIATFSSIIKLLPEDEKYRNCLDMLSCLPSKNLKTADISW